MTTYACYVVTSFWAYGELLMAIDLAERQRAAGVEPILIIPPSHVEMAAAKGMRHEMLIPGSRNLNVMLLHDVQRRFRPSAVILADALNYSFCERHYGLRLEDLDAFEAPVSTLDIYDFGQTAGRVDTYGFYAKNMREISFDRYHRLLQPSPIVAPGPPRDERIIKYPLFEGLDAHDRDRERASARQSLGFSPRDRVVMVASAVWQQMHRPYADVQPFIAACRTALDETLARVARNAVIVSVGATVVGGTREIPGLRRYGSLPAEEFDRITAACDLYLSNNYISTSMGRVVLRGVPTVLVQSSIAKQPGGDCRWFGREDAVQPPLLESVDRAYPFRMYPVGWHAFLRSVVRDNDFYRIMRHTELFDIDGSVALIEAVLRGEDARRSDSVRQRYCAQLGQLPTAAEIGVP